MPVPVNDLPVNLVPKDNLVPKHDLPDHLGWIDTGNRAELELEHAPVGHRIDGYTSVDHSNVGGGVRDLETRVERTV